MTEHIDSEMEDKTPTIKDLVADAGNKNSPTAMDYYEKAVNYFLADEHDLAKNPPRFEFTLHRLTPGDVEPKPFMDIILRPIDEDELKNIRARSEEKIVGGMLGGQKETNDTRFFTLLAVEAMVEPNLRDKRILAKHKTPERALAAVLQVGERVQVGSKVLELSGFTNTIGSRTNDEAQDIEAAKN